MSYTEKEFPEKARVRIHSVGTNVLDNKTGFILGKSFVNVDDHYIVQLDEPLPEASAICITEHCLELINEQQN